MPGPPRLQDVIPLRRRRQEEQQRTTNLELFYDLVFVFAVTQVSHLLLADLSLRGAAKSALVLLVVWWAWNYTTWVTNELDPDSDAVRLLLLGIMLASLLLAVSIPHAFGNRALLFAGSYVAIQTGRHLLLTFFAAGPGTIERQRASRILIWFAVAGVLWIGGALADDGLRVAFWVAALALDYCAPLALFWVPGLPRMSSDAWHVGSEHFAERFQLFIIIALGESVVVIGATTSDLHLNAARLIAFGLAFLTTAALWWLYFTYVATIAQRRLELAEDRTTLARDAYTYLHVVFVAGIIVTAVGQELVIAHPTDTLPGREVVAVVAGPTIYLLAHVLFRLRLTGTASMKRLTAAVACAAAGALGPVLPGLALASVLAAVLLTLIGVERLAAVRRRTRGEPSPLERLEASTGT
jgi:low temperature requirement protein LtrA